MVAGLISVVMLIAGSANASHYRLVDVPDVIPERYHAALKSAGIEDSKVLYERIVTKAGRREVAKSTRVMFATLSKWATFLDLMQLDGVGPKMVRLLNAVGVKTLADFQSQVGSTLQPKMRAANRGARYSEIVPSVGVVQGWIDLAKGVAVRLE